MKAYRDKPQDACQRIIDVLHYKDLRELAFHFMLHCPPKKKREVAKDFLEVAKQTLIKDSEEQRQKIQRVMDITKNFEAAAAEEEKEKKAPAEEEEKIAAEEEEKNVPEDLRDDSILEQLNENFNFATPSIATPCAAGNEAPSVAAAAAAAASAEEASAAGNEAPSVAAAAAAAASAEEASAAGNEAPSVAAAAAAASAEEASAAEEDTAAEEASSVAEFVYRVDTEFKEEDHWKKSTRGTSGFKYVTIDETKAKPWRVKVCALMCSCPDCALICLCPCCALICLCPCCALICLCPVI